MKVDNLINEKMDLLSDVDFASEVKSSKSVEDIIYDFADEICEKLDIDDKIALMDKETMYDDVLLYAEDISPLSLIRDVYMSLKGMDKDFLLDKGLSDKTVEVLTDNDSKYNFDKNMGQEALPVALSFGGLKDKKEYEFVIDSFIADDLIDIMFEEIGNVDDLNKSVVDYVGSEEVQKHKTLKENIKQKELLMKDVKENGMDLFKMARLDEIDKSIKNISEER